MPTRASPTVNALAPLRISFVGGGTDFPHWYEEHGGAVLSTTVDHYVRVTVSPRTDRQVRVRSLDLGQLVEYGLDQGPEYDGVMDLAKAAIERMGSMSGSTSTRSEAPPDAGLGGSSALVTAVVAAWRARPGPHPRGGRPALVRDRARGSPHHRWLAGSLRRGVRGCN